uniref:Uncharacterized protein n=1 Tax=Arundo donax TaxID=35708 RepID=A0A0A9EX05_ARUDO
MTARYVNTSGSIPDDFISSNATKASVTLPPTTRARMTKL